MEITAPMEIAAPSAPHRYSGTYSIVGAAESADFVKEESAAFAPKSQQIWLQKPAHGPAHGLASEAKSADSSALMLLTLP